MDRVSLLHHDADEIEDLVEERENEGLLENGTRAKNKQNQPFSPAKQVWRVIVNLISATTGTSTIAVPLMVRVLGIIPATVVLVLQGSLGLFSNHILSTESHGMGDVTYQGLMNSKIGTKTGQMAALAIFVNGVGKIVIWLIILTDLTIGSAIVPSGLLPELLRHLNVNFDEDSWFLQRGLWPFLLTLISLPAISFNSLDSISWVSTVGDVAVMFMTAVGAVLAGIAVSKHKACDLNLFPTASVHGLKLKEDCGVVLMRNRLKMALRIAGALPVLISSVFNQHSILSVTQQQHPYNQKNFDFAVATAAATTIAMKLIIGASSVLLFGSHLKADVLLNYSHDAISPFLNSSAAVGVAMSVKLAFLINGALSFPLYLHPLQSNLWGVLYGESVSRARTNNAFTFALTNWAVVGVCACVAAVIQDVEAPLAVLGATVVGYLAFVCPALLVLHKESRWKGGARMIAVWIMLPLAAFQAVAGILNTLLI